MARPARGGPFLLTIVGMGCFPTPRLSVKPLLTISNGASILQPIPTIAVLSSNPALTAVLGATLRRERGWRIREFRHTRDLRAYLRIAPMAVLVSDYDLGDETAADIAAMLRTSAETPESQGAQIIALARRIDPHMRRTCIQSGIDEIIVKPMSPLYLEERVRERIARGASNYIDAAPAYVGPERRKRIELEDRRLVPIERRRDNVIPFPVKPGG